MPRSASTWIYNIVLELNKLFNLKFSISGFINLSTYEFMNWEKSVKDVFKIHSYTEKFDSLNQHIFLYSCRDVREVAASLIAMKGWPKNYVLNHLNKQIIPDSLNWLNHPFRVLFPYNKIVEKPVTIGIIIANLLGIDITKKEIVKILQRHNKHAINKLIHEKGLQPDDNISRERSVDIETLYWHNHITGAGKDWKEIFDNDDFGRKVYKWLKVWERIENGFGSL